MTIFLTTAYMDEAERAHRVGLMHLGRLLTADTPEVIKGAFQGELLELRAENLRAARTALHEEPLARQVLAMGDRLMVTVANAAEAAVPLQEALNRAGVGEVQISRVDPGLEDLFVEIIRRKEG